MLLNLITKKERLGWYFLVFAGVAVYFSQERLLNIDCSNFLFHIINFETFCFPEHRMGVFLTQLPLIAAVHLKVPLSVLVPLYSLSFILVYFLAFWVCLKPLRNFPAAFAILLSLVMGLETSYFHPVTETHQAMVYTAVLYAWVSYPAPMRFWPKQLVTLLLIIWCALTHPVSAFSVSFVLAYYLVDSGQFRKLRAYVPLVFTLLVFVSRVLVTSSGYDADQYNHLKGFASAIPVFFELQPVQFIIGMSKKIYLIPILLFLYNNIMLLARKKFLLFLLHSGWVLGFTLISIFTFSHGDTLPMVEKCFLPGVFMIGFTFAVITFQRQERNVPVVLVGHIAVLYGLWCIVTTGQAYTGRLDYFRSIIAYQHTINQPKLIARPGNLNPTYLFNEWSMPIDMMVLSKLGGDSVAYTTYLTKDPDSVKEIGSDPEIYLHLAFWPYININDINRTYFNVPYGPYYTLPENKRL